MPRMSLSALVLVLFLCLPVWAAETKPAVTSQSSATLMVFNRIVTVFRVPYQGIPAEERAQRAEAAVRRQLLQNLHGPGKVNLEPIKGGLLVKLDGRQVFTLQEGDADLLQDETLEQVGKQSADALELVARETREARNLSALLKATGYALAATLVLLFLVWLFNRSRRWLAARLVGLAHTHAERLTVGGATILHRERLFSLVQRGVNLVFWLLVLFFFYDWLGFVLSRFPYTRQWGEQLNQYLVDTALQLGKAILRTIPELLVALLIFLTARFLIEILKTFFDRIEENKLEIAWLDSDTVRPTRRLVSAGIWLFALVMAYPYLPGSGTEAFKGLSVLVGLMISLGASSLVGQAASGLILMYTRTIRTGEYVQIAGNEGTVMELGLCTTRIRTGQGEELTLPNSLILGNVSRNYSRTVEGNGFILTTTVTIGYDTPWRQVQAMLVEAADRTPGINKTPPPQVFQTALSDFYPEYRLVCQAIPDGPAPRAALTSLLNATIQDVFNEYGVQIMSPHYRSDPDQPKVVPKEQWWLPPARRDIP
jgi:small-conductance mechanosensitive channel